MSNFWWLGGLCFSSAQGFSQLRAVPWGRDFCTPFTTYMGVKNYPKSHTAPAPTPNGDTDRKRISESQTPQHPPTHGGHHKTGHPSSTSRNPHKNHLVPPTRSHHQPNRSTLSCTDARCCPGRSPAPLQSRTHPSPCRPLHPPGNTRASR